MDVEKFRFLVPNVFHFAERKCTPDWKIEKRKNYFHDLTFVMGGKANYYVNGKKYAVEAGDLIYIPPGSIREAYTVEDDPMFAYPFNYFWLDPNNDIRLPFDIITKKMITKEIVDYIKKFNQIWTNQHSFEFLKARATFELILHRLLTNYYHQTNSYTDPRIKKVMSYVTIHYANEITIGELAEMLDLHPVYLGKLFKQYTGYTFKEYVNRTRINNAEILLSSGDFTVYETAERCGFQDISYFSNLFKSLKGYPPSSLKKHQKKVIER